MPVCFASKLLLNFFNLFMCLMLLVVGKGTYRNHGQPPVKHARKFLLSFTIRFYLHAIGFFFVVEI